MYTCEAIPFPLRLPAMNDLPCDRPISEVLKTAGPIRRTCVHEAQAQAEWNAGTRRIHGITKEAECLGGAG